MTGFGSSERITSAYSLKVEVRTLNSKFFDAIIKVPKEFNQWEFEIKSQLERGLKRGKVNYSLEFQAKEFEDAPVEVNEKLFNTYYQKFVSMGNGVNGVESEAFKFALGMPNVIVPIDNLESIISLKELQDINERAIENCMRFRMDEGEKLKEALLSSKNLIFKDLQAVGELDPARSEGIKNRIGQSMQELREKTQIDENRFEQELIYYLEKLDISEEKVRLQSHLDYFDEVINQDEANGKKLGFLAQEMGREINTIGSKANHAEIQRIVVGMKEELEKIKEQILNVL